MILKASPQVNKSESSAPTHRPFRTHQNPSEPVRTCQNIEHGDLNSLYLLLYFSTSCDSPREKKKKHLCWPWSFIYFLAFRGRRLISSAAIGNQEMINSLALSHRAHDEREPQPCWGTEKHNHKTPAAIETSRWCIAVGGELWASDAAITEHFSSIHIRIRQHLKKNP